MPSDRRCSRRYPLTLDLQYKITKGKRVLASGNGTTCDMSADGIAFVCSRMPLHGTSAELAINWPATLDGRALKMVARGRIVRVDALKVALTITRHEFRIIGNRELAEAARSLAAGIQQSQEVR